MRLSVTMYVRVTMNVGVEGGCGQEKPGSDIGCSQSSLLLWEDFSVASYGLYIHLIVR